ncbi:MAG: PfkB family carbohydrate kinase [Gemmobacter sp.]|jgi:sugar/nucleoside kinase (ribokinase family)|nr:PfkB family carbohydrate kinase [Gemmobacter sp.]
MTPDILCIGSVLWDIIGRAPVVMRPGDDVPGRITRQPGGVALNIAMTLRRFGLVPGLLSVIGRDAAGEELLAACARMGMVTAHVHRSDTLPTDRYLAVEGANGLIAAIADAHSLEMAGERILRPLADGRLGSAAAPWPGPVALDGNLTGTLLAEIAGSPLFAAADLRIAAVGSGKAARLRPLLGHPGATLHVNLDEARLLCDAGFPDAAAAAEGLLARGARRVLVTDGGRPCADGKAGAGILTATPPAVKASRFTGAGDTFMAAHIVAERRGADRPAALTAALKAAAAHISGHISGETGS